MANGTPAIMADGEEAAARPSLVGAGGRALSIRVVSQAAQLLLFIAAARVLTPADFGVFALVQAASVLLFVVAAAGWREFILAWSGSTQAVNQAITLSIFSGYAMAAIGLASAFVMTLVFDLATVGMLAALFSVCVLMAPMTSAFGAILVSRGHMRALALSNMAAELVGLSIGLWLLYQGWGVLALAAGKIAMQAMDLLGVIWAARWRLQLHLRGGFGSQIVEISRQILANRVIGFVMSYAATFIVGGYLGVTSVGFFRAAERVVSSISELIFEPLRLLGWMVFRGAADNARTNIGARDNLSKEASIFLPLLIVFASPIFVGLSVVSEEIVVVLLGEAWAPAAPVVSMLAVSSLLLIPTVTTEPLLTITGKIDRLPPVALLNAVVTVAVLFAFARFGLLAAAGARIFSSAVIMLSALWLQDRYAKAPWWGAIKHAAPVYTALVALVISVVVGRLVMIEFDISMAGRLAVEVVVGALAYFFAIFVIRPSYLRTVLWL
ncbi:MAG: oligosaccharide flippase family protein [Parvularculaceae bacterium]